MFYLTDKEAYVVYYTVIKHDDRLAQLVEHRTAAREVAGSNLGRTNTQGL